VKPLQEALYYVRNHCEACLENAESSATQMQLQLDIVSRTLPPMLGVTHQTIAVYIYRSRRWPNQCPDRRIGRKGQHFDEDHRTHNGKRTHVGS
jgi:hypothetical protein